MHRDFTIRPLSKTLVGKSFPFGQVLGFSDFAAWRTFIESYTRNGTPDSGVIAAENPRGYISGLLFYQANRHNQDGAALVCDPFVVADLPRTATPLRALLDAADTIALERGCKWVRVVLPTTGDRSTRKARAARRRCSAPAMRSSR